MQETHVKKSTKINFLETFKAFDPGESELIPFSETKTHTSSFASIYCKLRKQGLLTSKLSFYEVKNPAGTLILRRE